MLHRPCSSFLSSRCLLLGSAFAHCQSGMKQSAEVASHLCHRKLRWILSWKLNESWLIRVFNPRWSYVATMEKSWKVFSTINHALVLSHVTPTYGFIYLLIYFCIRFIMQPSFMQRRSKVSPRCFHPNRPNQQSNTKELPLVLYFHEIMRSFWHLNIIIILLHQQFITRQ